MGLFDLDECRSKKVRADESAKPPQPLPVEPVEVCWNGRVQTPTLRLVLLDGDKNSSRFRSPNAREHLEARLLPRENGVELDVLERTL